jgi:hypothetical protein
VPSVTGPETTLKNHFIPLSLVSMISGLEELCKSNECNENPKQPSLGGQSFNTKTWEDGLVHNLRHTKTTHRNPTAQATVVNEHWL